MKCPTCYLTEGPLGFAIILLAAVVLIRTVAGGGGVAPVPDMFDSSLTFTEALERSELSDKPVFAFVTADWCGPCQTMKRGALADRRVADVVRTRTEPVYIDGDEHPDIVQSLGVRGFPTVVIIRDGKIVDGSSGVMTTPGLLAWLDGALEREADGSRVAVTAPR